MTAHQIVFHRCTTDEDGYCDECGATTVDPPAQRHSRTSRQAAKEIRPYVPSIRARVHEVIIKEGPISDQAIAIKLGLAENTVRPRRVELVADGWARAAPDTVLTKSKRQATAWVAAEP